METSRSGVLERAGAHLWPVLAAVCFLLCVAISSNPSTASGALVKTASWGGDLERLNHLPAAMAYDSLGRAYVADYGTGRVVRIETDGSIDLSWSVGAPTGDRKQLNPADIAIDDADNVYVLDQKAWKVSKFDSDGNPLDSWSIEPGWEDSLHGIAAEGGSVFVISNQLVRRFTEDGDVIDWWGGFDTVEWYVTPLIRGDGDGNLLVTGSVFGPANKTAVKTIYRFEPDGDLIEKWSTPAEVYTRWEQYGDYDVEEIYDIEGYSSIAPLSDGNVWTVTDSNFITKYGPSGQVGDRIGEQGNGVVPADLATGPGDTLLYSWFGYASGPNATIRELDSSNSTIGEWTTNDFPKYADGDQLEGRFGRATDLTVRGDGAVGGYDPGYTRVQLFDSDGDFLKKLDGPDLPSNEGWSYGVSMVLPEVGGVTLVTKNSPEMFVYDEDGNQVADHELDLAGPLDDLAEDPQGGFVALGGEQIHFLNQSGSETGSFGTSPGSRVEADPSGRILVLGQKSLLRYSRTGSQGAAWNAPAYRCRGYRLDDVAVDAQGNAYVIALRGNLYYVLKFDPELDLLWEEPVESSTDENPASGYLDVGPDGSVFIDVGKGIEKYDQSGGSAQPIEPVCSQPQARKMRVDRIAYLRKRTAAKIRVRVYEPGRISLTGPRIARRVTTVPESGYYWVRATVRRSFTRRAKPRRLYRFPVSIGFRGATRSNSQALSLQLRARIKPLR